MHRRAELKSGLCPQVTLGKSPNPHLRGPHGEARRGEETPKRCLSCVHCHQQALCSVTSSDPRAARPADRAPALLLALGLPAAHCRTSLVSCVPGTALPRGSLTSALCILLPGGPSVPPPPQTPGRGPTTCYRAHVWNQTNPNSPFKSATTGPATFTGL